MISIQSKNANYLSFHIHSLALLNVIFSNESGQNLTLVKPTQYDGRS